MIPLQTLYFRIEIDSIQVATFLECSGLIASRKIDYIYEGGNNEFPYVLPGPRIYAPIQLKKGMLHNVVFWKWYSEEPSTGKIRKNGSIILCKPNGEEARRWNFFNAFPILWKGPSFNALEDELAIEEVQIVHEGLELVENA